MLKLKELCFEIISNCYLNCIYCSSFDDVIRKRDNRYLPFSLIKKVINDFYMLGGEVLELSGGEPLMHPQIFDIVDYALNKGIDVIVYTSGVLPDSYNIKDVLNKLQKIGLKKIVFNCQGLSKVHESLVRREGAFTKLIHAIECSKEIDLWIGVHFVLNKQNYFQLEEVHNFLNQLGVDELALLRLVKQGRAKQNWNMLEIEGSNYIKFFRDVYMLARTKSSPTIRVGCPFDFMNILYPDWAEVHDCHAGRSSLDIMANGDIFPCPAFKDVAVAKLGNIFNDPLEKVWRESVFLKKLRNIIPSQITFCNECNFLNSCKGRCTAQRILENGSLFKGPDPLCKKMYLYRKKEEKISQLRCNNFLTVKKDNAFLSLI